MEKERILVVDDDRDIVQTTKIQLEKEGYEVLCAYDGMEALDVMTRETVQLLIIDIMMPKLDGFSAIMKIREKKNLPIIVMSAKSEDTDTYIRDEEEFSEVIYSHAELEEYLKKAGFEIVGVYDEFTKENLKTDSQRAVYVCKKVKQTNGFFKGIIDKIKK